MQWQIKSLFHHMARAWLAGLIAFCAATGILTYVIVVNDRDALLKDAESRTRSLTRLFIEHAERSLEDGEKIFVAVQDKVAAWDLRTRETGHELFEQMRLMLPGSPQLSAAWIMDTQGNSIVDTWSNPPRPINASGREYFKQHVAGELGPLVSGQEIGAVIERPRFTLSRAVVKDGSLHAVLAIGFESRHFAALYSEVANWPDARAGLFVRRGSYTTVLAKADGPLASPAYMQQLLAHMDRAPAGAALITESGGARVGAWQRSSKYPEMFAATSHSVDDLLSAWRIRTLGLAALVGTGALAFCALGIAATSAGRSRRHAELNALLLAEVHHRMKNNLGIVAALIRAGRRNATQANYLDQFEQIEASVMSISALYGEMQTSYGQGGIELQSYVDKICRNIEGATSKDISVLAGSELSVSPDTAMVLVIVLNELITNSIKHAGKRIQVRCDGDGSSVIISVSDDGPGLPDDFDLDKSQSYGHSNGPTDALRPRRQTGVRPLPAQVLCSPSHGLVEGYPKGGAFALGRAGRACGRGRDSVFQHRCG